MTGEREISGGCDEVRPPKGTRRGTHHTVRPPTGDVGWNLIWTGHDFQTFDGEATFSGGMLAHIGFVYIGPVKGSPPDASETEGGA